MNMQIQKKSSEQMNWLHTIKNRAILFRLFFIKKREQEIRNVIVILTQVIHGIKLINKLCINLRHTPEI